MIKKEILSFSILLMFISIIEIVRNFFLYTVNDYCDKKLDKNPDAISVCFSEYFGGSLLMYLVLFDKLMGAETMIIVMIIIRYKKCEDYIAKFSKLQTMAIVSIH